MYHSTVSGEVLAVILASPVTVPAASSLPYSSQALMCPHPLTTALWDSPVWVTEAEPSPRLLASRAWGPQCLLPVSRGLRAWTPQAMESHCVL